jgi:hypothetical protein
MSQKQIPDKNKSTDQHQPHRMRLPGFITDREIGLGDIIKRTTYTLGIKPCPSCERRAAALNRWVVFTGQYTK